MSEQIKLDLYYIYEVFSNKVLVDLTLSVKEQREKNMLFVLNFCSIVKLTPPSPKYTKLTHYTNHAI